MFLFGGWTSGRRVELARSYLIAGQLPFHELGECAVRPRAEFPVVSLLGDLSIRTEDDDYVGAFDSRESMGNADSSVVTAQKCGESTIDKGFGLCVEGGGSFIENENVWVLDQRTGNGNALLLATRELRTTRAYSCIESIRLMYC